MRGRTANMGTVIRMSRKEQEGYRPIIGAVIRGEWGPLMGPAVECNGGRMGIGGLDSVCRWLAQDSFGMWKGVSDAAVRQMVVKAYRRASI